ncbi:MAG: YlzJ-like family protein [Syntrophomonadales bacterium]
MIIYTGMEDYFTCWNTDWDEAEIVLEDSSRLVVRPQGYNRATVLRLITSDPQQYLRSEFQPGTEIELPLSIAQKK